MNVMRIAAQVALLYVFYYMGNAVQHWLKLPIPGSIIGMLLLFTALILRACPVQWIEAGAGFLLKYLALLFVPVTVGVMNYFHVFTNKGLILPAVVLLSTLMVMVTAGFSSERLAKRKEHKTCQDGLSQSR